MRKFYLFLMMLFVQLITTNVSAQTDEEYFVALAAIGEDGYYYVTTNYAGVKYYLTADGTLTSEIDNACLFDFTRSDGGEFKAFGYLLDASYDFSISLGKAGRDVADGVKDIPAAIEKVSQPGNVYSMDGKLLRSGATLNSLKAMGNGIYIFNGVKVVVK